MLSLRGPPEDGVGPLEADADSLIVGNWDSSTSSRSRLKLSNRFVIEVRVPVVVVLRWFKMLCASSNVRTLASSDRRRDPAIPHPDFSLNEQNCPITVEAALAGTDVSG